MARTQTMVQLSDVLVDALDREAARRRTSRSAVIRDAIERYLDDHGATAEIRCYVDGYERVPPTVPDAWGDAEREAELHSRELAQRLDAEEREAGPTW